MGRNAMSEKAVTSERQLRPRINMKAAAGALKPVPTVRITKKKTPAKHAAKPIASQDDQQMAAGPSTSASAQITPNVSTPAVKRPSAKKITSVPSNSRLMSLITDEQSSDIVMRAIKEKLYILNGHDQPPLVGPNTFEFKVSGCTGNIYKVTIGPKVKCSCRDYIFRRRHCKHIMMILLKYFHCPPNSHLFETLSPSHHDLSALATNMPPDPSALVTNAVRMAIREKLEGKPVEPLPGADRRPLDTSDCPICCDEFDAALLDQIIYCRVCGNNVHADCFARWRATGRSQISCVFCRSPWEPPTKKVAKPARGPEGYVNVGKILNTPERRVYSRRVDDVDDEPHHT
ncbi:hypothetical protein DM01DRAFT_1408265 [Hesseltinella vesiculosa]|uniref:SWIM-type domain-containing protein n=1 Tax=Hesseltinella vesiculosa TaxID=101127 RepID=A0A1X2GG39_9FUNG|nr:hypothetical protein DM01DRAFT_1408265 [Hesseltinella vesiculosa]